MTLDQLEIFITIASEGGLRAASKKLHKTQPTLSVGIKNLEEELGLKLLDRDSYRVKLTSEGESLLREAQSILSHVEKFQVKAREFSMGREPKLNLAIDYLCPLSLLLNVLNQFSQLTSQTKIEMDFEVLSGAQEKLLRGEANIAITPFITQHSKVEIKKICDVRIVPVVSKLVIKSANPKIEELLKLPQIVVRDSASKSSSKESSNASFGSLNNARRWVVSDHMIKRELIINGFGWGHLEYASIEAELKSESLTELKVQGLKSTKLPLYLARSLTSPVGPSAGSLWDYLVDKFRDLN